MGTKKMSDPLLHGMKPASSVTYLTDTLGDRAVSYIKQHASEPLCLYLAFNAAHTPMEASPGDGAVVAVREVGGFHHRYERRAA